MDYTLHKDNPMFKQHVVYMNRWEFINLAKQPKTHLDRCAAISFNDTLDELKEIRSIARTDGGSLLSLIVPDDESMNEGMARTIFQFVVDNMHRNFVVHCFAGASRSVAVAKWIAEYLEFDAPSLQDVKYYNQHIYNLLKQME